MATNDKRLSQIKSCLKSLLVMQKHGYALEDLKKDYMDMMGKRLDSDIRPMGFKSVEEFLSKIPDVVRRERSGYGDDVFRAVADASTRHIVDLVAKTPASKSQRKKGQGSKLWRGKPKGWSRSQVRSYSPPRSYGRNSRGMGGNYGMDDFDIGGDNRYSAFDEPEDDKFSDEDMVNYKNKSAPLVSEKSISKDATSQITNQTASNHPLYQPASSNANNNNDIKESSDKVLLVNRIEKLVANKVNGVYATLIQKQYEKLYKEQLTSRWWEKIKSMNAVRVEPFAPGSDVMLVYPASASSGEDLDSINNASTAIIANNHKSEVESQNSMEKEKGQFPINSKPQTPVGLKDLSKAGLTSIKSCQTEIRRGVVSRQEVPRVTSNVELKSALIPSIGSYFDVVVTLAVSPQNLTVQPYMEAPKLRSLMADLNAFYKDPSNELEAPQKFKVGDYFAASNVGGDWYRMMITKIINTHKLAVKYVDFGYQSIIDKSKLRALQPQFRHLPIQAISASLAGAHPRNNQAWSLEAKVWFNQRVVGGHFVGVVKEVQPNSGGLLGVDLELIDTSNTSQDTSVLKQLLERF